MARNATNARPPQDERENPAPPDYDSNTGEVYSRDVVRQSDFGRVEQGGFRVVKHVSVPMLEVPAGQPFVCRLVDKMRVLQPIEGHKPQYPGEHIASTIESPTGDVRLFTWSKVFKSEMERDYPNDSYVGRWFQVTKLPKKRDKRYYGFAITEVEPMGQAA